MVSVVGAAVAGAQAENNRITANNSTGNLFLIAKIPPMLLWLVLLNVTMKLKIYSNTIWNRAVIS
jgi:hypothetical protein